jgi:hypothetical protein
MSKPRLEYKAGYGQSKVFHFAGWQARTLSKIARRVREVYGPKGEVF